MLLANAWIAGSLPLAPSVTREPSFRTHRIPRASPVGGAFDARRQRGNPLAQRPADDDAVRAVGDRLSRRDLPGRRHGTVTGGSAPAAWRRAWLDADDTLVVSKNFPGLAHRAAGRRGSAAARPR
jgi:hypothetical protein